MKPTEIETVAHLMEYIRQRLQGWGWTEAETAKFVQHAEDSIKLSSHPRADWR